MNAVPAYLLDHGENGTAQPSEQAVAEPSSDDDSCSDECERIERRADRWNANANALDQCRERELLEERVKRAREAATSGTPPTVRSETLSTRRSWRRSPISTVRSRATLVGDQSGTSVKGENLEGVDRRRCHAHHERRGVAVLHYRGFRPFGPSVLMATWSRQRKSFDRAHQKTTFAR